MITPNELFGLTDDEMVECNVCEKQIDDKLRRLWADSQPLKLSVLHDFGKMGQNQKVRVELMRRYKAAGWVISKEDSAKEVEFGHHSYTVRASVRDDDDDGCDDRGGWGQRIGPRCSSGDGGR